MTRSVGLMAAYLREAGMAGSARRQVRMSDTEWSVVMTIFGLICYCFGWIMGYSRGEDG